MPGLFKKEREELLGEIENVLHAEFDDDFKTQVTAMSIFIGTIFVLRVFNSGRLKALSGEHVLDISALNDANLFKEVFLAYLNAAVLEPILAIGGMQEVEGIQLVIELFTLGSICWWIWLITDAFDFEDITQFYKYHVDIKAEREKDPKRFAWLQLKDLDKDAEIEQKVLSGSVTRDIALWFMIACIGAAWLPGGVTHRDVLHAYVVLFCWIIMHHLCRRATHWSTGYLMTFFFPSTALMPLEYCLPLMDVADTVEDIEWLENYREFLVKRTGVELTIKS